MVEEKFKQIKNKLHNHTEDIILETMESMIEKEFPDICTCEHCLLDIASYALNRLPAKYFSSYEGNIHTKISEFEQQYQVDIVSHVTRAINLVEKNPSEQCKNKNK